MSYRSVGRNIKKLVIIAGEVLLFTVSYTYVAVADGRCEHCGRSHQQNQYHQYCRGNMTHSFHTVLHAIPSFPKNRFSFDLGEKATSWNI